MEFMRLGKTPLYRILIIICLLCIIILISISAFSGYGGQAGTMMPVHIIGTYSVDGGEPQKLTENTEIDIKELHTVIINGHFSTDIPKDYVLMFHADNVRVSIEINGNEIYRFGGKDSTPLFSKTAGNTWGKYISPGITESDEAKITLENVYTGTVSNVFNEFMNDMSFGHGNELYETILQNKTPSMLFGFIILIIGITVLITCVVARFLKMPGMKRGIALSCLTIAGGLWIFIDGGYPYVALLFENPSLFNTIDVLQVFTIPVVFALYVYTYLENNKVKKIAEILTCISLAVLTVAVVLQITGLYDLYELQSWAVALSIGVGVFFILLLGYEAFQLKNRQSLFILLSWLPFFAAATMEITNFYFKFMPERSAIKYGFALSVLLQFIYLIRVLRSNVEKNKKTVQLEYELLQSRIAVMLSQIQPHFLFNTLNDIRFLYRESPGQAEEALVSFTRYLRGNMDSLSQTDLVPFTQELDHLKHYIAIEQIRFGERLKVVFELGCMEFFLPVLTIQPLVENAIRHGVTKKREGGTVTIHTSEDAENYNIRVYDNGVGYNAFLPKEDGQSHYGLQNVLSRLQSMCAGGLEIESRIGEGTCAWVRIPKEKQK
jgi:two-component system LytT family sensor kinase